MICAEMPLAAAKDGLFPERFKQLNKAGAQLKWRRADNRQCQTRRTSGKDSGTFSRRTCPYGRVL